MSRLTARAIAQETYACEDLDDRGTVTAMALVRATSWEVQGKVACTFWRTLYKGPETRRAMHAVQDHEEVRVFYVHGDRRTEIPT